MRLRTILVAVGLAVLAWLVGVTFPALSQTTRVPVQCAPIADMMTRLASDYGEMPLWRGERGPVRYILTVSGKGSWTVLATNGTLACIMAAGNANSLDRGT